MSIENAIKDVITEKLNDGTIEKIVAQKFEEAISSTMGDLFKYYGTGRKLIEKKIEEAIVPVIEKHDFSKYVTKLDAVMIDVIKAVAGSNNRLLDNFKDLMDTTEVPKQIMVSEIFDEWIKYAEDNINTSGLEVITDDKPHYESTDAIMEVKEIEQPRYSSREKAIIKFESEHDEEVNWTVPLWKWDGDKDWKIDNSATLDICSLSSTNVFSVYIMRLMQAGTKITLDAMSDSGDIDPTEEPEASFS
jgi:hypothetical protein